MQPGTHVLIRIPYGVKKGQALLWVDADAEHIGGACADTYFQSVNVSGSWASVKREAQKFASFKGFAFKAGGTNDYSDRKWITFGPLSLKVVHGRTKDAVPYLNLFVRNLKFAGHVIGGLLGEDDHLAVETPDEMCQGLLDV